MVGIVIHARGVRVVLSARTVAGTRKGLLATGPACPLDPLLRPTAAVLMGLPMAAHVLAAVAASLAGLDERLRRRRGQGAAVCPGTRLLTWRALACLLARAVPIGGGRLRGGGGVGRRLPRGGDGGAAGFKRRRRLPAALAAAGGDANAPAKLVRLSLARVAAGRCLSNTVVSGFGLHALLAGNGAAKLLGGELRISAARAAWSWSSERVGAIAVSLQRGGGASVPRLASSSPRACVEAVDAGCGDRRPHSLATLAARAARARARLLLEHRATPFARSGTTSA